MTSPIEFPNVFKAYDVRAVYPSHFQNLWHIASDSARVRFERVPEASGGWSRYAATLTGLGS